MEIGWSGTTLARNEPLTPRSISSVPPSTLGVKYNPDATVKLPLHCQLERIWRGARRLVKRSGDFRRRADRTSSAREFVGLIETGKTAVGGDLKRILRHDHAAVADGGGIVERLGKNVLHADAEAF